MKTIQILILFASIATLLADTPSELATEQAQTTIVDASPTIYSVGTDGSAVPISTVDDPNGTGASITGYVTTEGVTATSAPTSSATVMSSSVNASSVMTTSANMTSTAATANSSSASTSSASILIASSFSVIALVAAMSVQIML